MRKGIKKALVFLAAGAVLALTLWLYVRPYAVEYTANGMRFSHQSEVSGQTLADSAVPVHVSGTLRRVWVKQTHSFSIAFSGTLRIGDMAFDEYAIWFSEDGVGHFMRGKNSVEPYGASALFVENRFSKGYVVFYDAEAGAFHEMIVWPAQTVEEAKQVFEECSSLSKSLLRAG